MKSVIARALVAASAVGRRALLLPALLAALLLAVASQSAEAGYSDAIRKMVPGGRVISGYCVSSGCSRYHRGVDVGGRYGAPVRSIVYGRVSKVYYDPSGGYAVIVKDNRGRRWYFAHFRRRSSWLSPGERVYPGKLIGYLGSSGNATRAYPHVHFHVTYKGAPSARTRNAVNPKRVLRNWPNY